LLCSLLHYLVTSSLSCLNTLLSTLFLNGPQPMSLPLCEGPSFNMT
jgi:hypothetical protein